MMDSFWSPLPRNSLQKLSNGISHHNVNFTFSRSSNQDDVAQELEDEFGVMGNGTPNVKHPVKILRRNISQEEFESPQGIDGFLTPYIYMQGESRTPETTETHANKGWYELDMSGIGLRTISLDIRLYPHLTGLYLNNNRLQSIPEEIFADLKNLVTLDLSYNLITSIPLEITQITTLEKLILTENRISELPPELGRLYRLKEMNVDGNPIHTPPQAILQGGVEHTISYLRDRMVMGPPPPERRFISYVDPNQITSLPDRDKFKVLTYNILAESYTSSANYFYCPSWALDWNYRKQGILKEILAYDADIICLQEVESLQYTDYFEPELAKVGYAGVFSPKSRARTMEDWTAVDGCVIFYKRNRYSLVEEYVIEYQSIAMTKHKEFSVDQEAFSRLITKDNIALAAILQFKDEGANGSKNGQRTQKPRYMLVCNTHIHWNPEHKDVKLIQVQMLIEQLSAITSPKSKWHRIPMVVCGDFNSLVDSGPYELLSTGLIKPRHPDLEPFNYGAYSSHGYHHAFQLSSAYAPIGEPSFTNYTGDFVGVLDYLWYTQDSLSVSKVLQPVDEETVRLTRLPNAYMNSDHISLLSEFFFTRPSKP